MKKLVLLLIFIFTITICKAQWQLVYGSFNAFNMFAYQGNTVYTGAYNAIYVSEDNGDNWTTATPVTNTNTSLAAIGSTLISGSSSGIKKSTDNGQTWTASNNGLTTNGKSINTLIVKGSKLFAGTWEGVFVSEDTAASWTQINNGFLVPSPTLIVKSFAINSSGIFVSIYAYGAGIYYSDDDGATWTISNPFLNGPISMVADENDIFAANGYDIYHSGDNGTNWAKKDSGFTNFEQVNSLAISGNNVFAGTGGGGVFRLSDNGDIWKPKNEGLTSLWVSLVATTDEFIFAGTSDGLYRRPLSDITGIETHELENTFVLFPNPATTTLTVNCGFLIEQNCELKITNTFGQLVYNSAIQNPQSAIDVSSLSPGIYFLTLDNGEQTVSSRFLKQ
jgi:photosystem II stability/assembly factor-like uncharacterized protein